MSKEKWERIYQQGEQINIAPYTEIFSFISRNFGEDAQNKRFLEVGCGVGNNLIFAKWAFDFDVYGIDQSEEAINIARSRFESKQLDFVYLKPCNILQLEFDNNFFDIVVDRSAIQHNTIKNVEQIISEIRRVLKVNGLFYSCITSDLHPVFDSKQKSGNNDYFDDEIGNWHLFSKSDIIKIFDGFKILKWYHKIRYDLPDNIIKEGCYHMELKKK